MSRPYYEWTLLAQRWDKGHYPGQYNCLCDKCKAARAEKTP